MRFPCSMELSIWKEEIGDGTQPQPPAEFPAKERDGVIQSVEGLTDDLFIAESGEVDARQLQIGSHVDGGNGNETDPRIVQTFQQQRRHFLVNLFADPM